MERNSDVIIVGGGPAGLSCALILARCKRKVLIFDAGNRRNKGSGAIHGFITRDGEHPADFIEKAREEVKSYNVEFVADKILNLTRTEDGFTVLSENKGLFYGRKILLATGLSDHVPEINGIENYYGKSVFHCPHCDGWEFRDKPWVVYTLSRASAVEVSLRFKTWTNDITLMTRNVRGLTRQDKLVLAANGIKLCNGSIKGFDGIEGQLRAVLLEDGSKIPAAAFFFHTGHSQQSDFGRQLKCRLSSKGRILYSKLQRTSVHGVYVAGDATSSMHLVIIAAAEGAKAAIAIDAELNKEDRVKLL
jgi:thioredoxin reductase